MAENSGHLVIVETSPDASTYTEIDGLTSFSGKRDRTSIDFTNFKSAAATSHKVAVAGMRAATVSLSGNLAAQDSTFAIDVGQANLITAARAGSAVACRTKVDGSSGTYVTLAAARVASFEISAEIDGLVTFSVELQSDGASWT
jgi:TP901-1 family phage major tail protein